MPLFQYFGWVGSVLLAALFAASWWLPGNLAGAPSSQGAAVLHDCRECGHYAPRIVRLEDGGAPIYSRRSSANQCVCCGD
jgi:hypothetical protein